MLSFGYSDSVNNWGMIMKKLTVAAATAVALVGSASAFAADMPLKAPPPVAVFSWTGCYGGVNAGWIGGRTFADLQPTGAYLNPAGGAAPPNAGGTGALPGDRLLVSNSYSTGSGSSNNSSWEGGVQVGCNQQLGVVVWGFEADWQWSGLNRSFDAVYPAFGSVSPGFTIAPHTEHVTSRLDWFSTVRGRLGFTPWDRVLLYGTAGAVFADVKSETSVNFGTFPVLPVYNGAIHTGSDSRVKAGVVVGSGVEWAFAPQWSFKAEALYFWVEGLNYNSPLVAAVPAFAPGYAWNTNINNHIGVARIGVNYRFWSGGVGPVTAAY
jgi:outer membrane immunogenic protein